MTIIAAMIDDYNCCYNWYYNIAIIAAIIAAMVERSVNDNDAYGRAE